MFDLVIANATAVVGDLVAPLDVAISNGVIAAIGQQGAFNEHSEQVVDATGRLLVPGGIDPHIHCDWPYESPLGEPRRTAGCGQVSRAAVFGGTTTLLDFVMPVDEEDLLVAAARHEATWSADSYCDFSFHVLLEGTIRRRVLDQVPEVVAAGLASFKVFTTNVRPFVSGRRVDYGSLRELLVRVGRAGGIVAVHAEDDDLVMHAYGDLRAANQVAPSYLPTVHSALSEELAFRRVIALAREIDGAALYLMHVSAASGVDAIRDAKTNDMRVFGETLPQYLLRTQEDYASPDGRKFHTYPSLKSSQDNDALWRGLRNGSISTIATDELCTTYAEKMAGDRLDNVLGGNTGVEPRMALAYTEAVVNRGFSLSQFAAITSTNAARILGLHPRKGVIAVGSDADLVVLDPGKARRIAAQDLHESDYSPWEGYWVAAWPDLVLLRGRIVVRGNELLGAPGDGRMIARRRVDDLQELAGVR